MLRAFLLLVFLSACASTPPRSTTRDTVFDLSGRIGVRYDHQGFSGSLRWIRRTGSDELWLLSPLGQTVAHITRGPSGAKLETSDRKVYEARDVAGLTEEVLGWRLPLQGLDSWILGKASPGSPAAKVPDGDELLQDGWDIRYENRFESGLPRTLVLEREDIRIKLLLNPPS